MRKIIKTADKTRYTRRSFEFTFEDGSVFNFDVVLDNGEWVAEVNGDSQRGVRLCSAEIEEIAQLLDKLNINESWMKRQGDE